MIYVDSNIILDILTNDPKWYEWSASRLEKYSNSGQLIINEIIYAEISIGFEKIEELEEIIKDEFFKIESIPKEALFLAGKVFLKYKKQNGNKTSILPDFFIGAHAIVKKSPLLTRDVKRYKTYYPTLDIISPENDK